mgnify:FL=1
MSANPNSYGLVAYFDEVFKSASTEVVVVDRRKLRDLVRLAKSSQRYVAGKHRARLLGAAISGPIPTPDEGGGVMLHGFKCDACGRFMRPGSPGSSWSQQWSHDMSGYPDLHDPKYRCATCTDAYGVGRTNCAPSFPGNGRYPRAALKATEPKGGE